MFLVYYMYIKNSVKGGSKVLNFIVQTKSLQKIKLNSTLNSTSRQNGSKNLWKSDGSAIYMTAKIGFQFCF